MSLKGKTLVKGHSLLFEGAAFGRSWNQSGAGMAKCTCGLMSPELPNRAARKRWHKQHKEEVKTAQTAAGPDCERVSA